MTHNNDMKIQQERIRNFCIIAHIDHGKSTLADRFLEITKTIDKRKMKNQVLDQLDLERERGITIKLAPVTMHYRVNGELYTLNLIDTPGHVDFSYEVSRSLASVEGAILLVDATQGIEAQTLSNLYLALDHNLSIIPVINKIDLPGARVDLVREELVHLLGVSPEDVLSVSAKTGQNVSSLLEAVVQHIPPPKISGTQKTRALIFDSLYDEYKGVVAYVRIVEGSLRRGETLKLIQTQKQASILEVGMLRPHMEAIDTLDAGHIGYIVTGLKKVADLHVGDTVTVLERESTDPLPGYKQLQPMVFAGMYTKEGDDYADLRDALQKFSLNDSSLRFDPDHSPALGFGFRCGFLGLLHLDIVSERIHREYGLNVVVTVPSVAYHVYLNDAGVNAWKKTHKEKSPLIEGKAIVVANALELPDVSHIDHIEEPWVRADLVTPSSYIGNIMDLVSKHNGIFLTTDYLDAERAIMKVELPLASILVDFYDKLKSVSSGYASYHYDLLGYKPADVVRLDIIVAQERVDALASIVYKDQAERIGRSMVERLKDVIPQQLFEVKIQAALGARIVASSRIAALRKDVTAKLYGGDVTRKRKLLEKQKKGKKRMLSHGQVDIPHQAFLAVLKR